MAADTSTYMRPIAVVPPATGKSMSHLIVGTCGEHVLRVIALPSLTLVHTHVMEGILIRSLAADPSGRAIAVSDSASNEIHVLAWPLPGMPPLE